MCGIDERDEGSRAIKAEPGFLVIRTGAGTTGTVATGNCKVVHHRLDLLIREARQRLDPAWEQLQNVTRDGIVERRDPAREHIADGVGRG